MAGSRWRRLVALVTVPVTGAGSALLPVSVVAGAAVVTAVSVAVASAPAKASLSGSVLILSSSVNGGTSSAEYQAATALGLTATVATDTQWPTENFSSFKAIIIGDPSTSSCSTPVPSEALSTAGTWGPAVTGNVAVLGTAPVLGGATGLISDAIAYAASGSGTGLYVSLNCEYSSASAGTAVPLLASVDGGGFTVTGQGSNCPSDAGTVNTWQALALSQFNGLTSASLGPWSSPACSVEESFHAWPAGLGGLGYYTSASPATFTASDGATGQAYLLAGAPASSATAGLSPSTGGQVPAGSTSGGGANPAAPGIGQAGADGANTENGDYTQSDTDLSVTTYGPSLDFTRTYDAQVAQAQTQTGTPGPMGYGWTDNWATSLVPSDTPVPGDVYAVDGTGLSGLGGPATSVAMNEPDDVLYKGGNTYIADDTGNRVLEIAGSTGTQWGISMTAGDEYVIAGSTSGAAGRTADGTPGVSSLLNGPSGLAMDPSGDLYIADFSNNRVVELAASSGTQWGISMTADDLYRVAGHSGGSGGHSGNGGAATSAYLDEPSGVTFGHGTGDLYIADSGNNRIQEVPAATGSQWGISMTANDVYTVAGSASGSQGTSGNGVAATSALLNMPNSLSFSSGGDMYIADTFNDRIIEVPASGGTQWGISMTADDIYTVAGSVTGASGSSGNGGAATSAKLDLPYGISVDNGTQIYIADSNNSEIREVARTTHTEWGQSMTANDIYRIAGTGTAGFSGDGGAATSAKLDFPYTVSLDGSFNLFIADGFNSRVREVSASTSQISEVAGDSWTLSTAGDSGSAVNASLFQPDGVATDPSGNIYIADTANNRVQEIAVSSHTQFGGAMMAGDVYTIAGDPHGSPGSSGDGGLATSALLNAPWAVAADTAGNVYVTDQQGNTVREIAAASHTQWGISMTAGDIYTIAGNGTTGHSGNGGVATSAELAGPQGVAVDSSGNLFIADAGNSRIQEVPATSGTHYGISMTANDIYTIAGSATGAGGYSGDGGAATSALLDFPSGVALDGSGDVYIADTFNNRVQELYNGGQSWGQHMTTNDIYTIAGSATGTSGLTGDGGPAAQALLNRPATLTLDGAGNVYLTDSANNRVQEIAAADGTQWSQQMTAGDIYTVAGSATGASGLSGDGGPATAALFQTTQGLAVDPSGNLYLTGLNDNLLREVVSASGTPFPVYPAPGSPIPGTTSNYAGGATITQPGDAQVTFYPVGSGCVAPYTAVSSGQYCALPEDVGANLSYSSGTYTLVPQPGTSYTYNSAGQLAGVSDAAGDALTVQYGTPLPGSGNCPLAASWCELITAPVGSGGTARTLTIGYNSSNLVTSVTDPMGRQWTYGYTGSDLTSATDPMSNVTSYAYGAGTTGPLNANDLTSITSPNAQPGGPDAGASAAIAYNAAGQVTSQTDPMGYTTSVSYCVSATAGDCMNASTGSGFITVSDPDGNSTVYYYIQGTLGAQSAWTGTTLTSEQDNVPDQTMTTGDNSAGTQANVATEDGDSRIATASYGAGGLSSIAAVPSPAGGQATADITQTSAAASVKLPNCESALLTTATCVQVPGSSLSVAVGPSTVSPSNAIALPSSIPPQGITWTQYDNDGNMLWTTTGVYEPGSNTASSSQTAYELHQGNSVTLNGTNITCTYTPAPPSLSLPCAAINPDGVVTQFGYNAQGDLVYSATPDGNAGGEVATTTYQYDSDGEQTGAISPDGNLAGANAGNYTTTTAYNNDGQQTSVTQGDGSGHTVTPRVASFSYDADGNQTTVQDARGYTSTTTYNADDEATLVSDPDSHVTLTCYDGTGNVTQVVPPVGVAANSLTASSCPASYPSGYGNRLASDATTYTYNGLGQQTQVTTPAPAGQTGYETTTYAYDANGNVTKVTAPPTSNSVGAPSQVTTSTYTNTGQLATQTQWSGSTALSTVSYCYDPNGDTTAVIYADGNSSAVAPCNTNSAHPWIVDPTTYPTQAAAQTTYSYDSSGELVSTTAPTTTAAPSGATWSYTYGPGGDNLTSTDPNGITTTMAYTPFGQVSGVTYSGSSAHSVSYSYDADGNRTSMSDVTGTSTYGYDSFGELTSDQNGAGRTVSYGYNADGQVIGITYPLPSNTWASTSTVNYTYDNADLLTKVTDFNANAITITGTADGLGSSATLGSAGDTITATYDNTDSPSSIALKNGSTTLQSFSYADSPAGTILSETDTPSSTQAYTYDAKGRVTSMTPGGGSPINYTYDASGNLTTLPTGASATSGYDNAGELTSSTLSGTTTSYAYDADGRRLTTKQGATTLTSATWDGASELTSYTSPSANMTAATYDGDGLRATATIGSQAQAFTWASPDGSPDLIMDSTNAYIYATGTAPAEQVNLATGAVTYLVADSLGSVRGVVSSSGSLTGTTSYDAWGNPLTTGGLTATTPFGYAGGYSDPTGLIYLTNRYYDPATGQFSSLDPQVNQTLEPFGYAGGNPVSATDPTGLGPSGPPPGPGECGPDVVPSCRYSTAVSWTQNQMWTVVYGHGNFHSIFEDINSDWEGSACIDVILVGSCVESLSDWAGMVHAGGGWDLKVGLGKKQWMTRKSGAYDGVAIEPYELPYYSRVTYHTQIYYNVWGNIFYGFVGKKEGFPAGILDNLPKILKQLGLASGIGKFFTLGNSIERQMGYVLGSGGVDTSDAINRVIQAKIHEMSTDNICDALPYPPGSRGKSCGS